MPLDIDGFLVFRGIAAHPAAFQDIAKEVTAAARTLVVKQLKSKAIDLERLHGMRAALEGETFALVTDGMPDAQIKALLTKLDKHHPELGASTPEWRRQRLLALASGTETPVAKVKAPPKQKPPRKQASKKSTSPAVLNFESAGATSGRRRDHSDG